MPIEIEAPDGAVIEFPDGTPDATIKGAMARAYGGPQAQTWGEYGRDVLRQLGQGVSFSFADEIEAGARALLPGSEGYSAEVERIRRGNERFSGANPGTARLANLAGGIVPFTGGPLGAAARWAAAGRTLPRTMARSGALGAGVGAASGLGAGEQQTWNPAERLPGAMMGGTVGAGIGAAVPPVIAGGARALDFTARAVAPQTYARLRSAMAGTPGPPPAAGRGPPVEGAVFVDNPAPEVASAQEGALRLVADQLLRAGKSAADVEAMLARARETGRFHGSGRAQDVATLADLDQALARLAGSAARQYPEVARDTSRFITARQTGLAPAGEAQALAGRGLPTAERFAGPITAEQAESRLGTTFAAGEGNVVPRSHRARIFDALKRALHIKDSDFHGHAASPSATLDQIVTAAKAEADKLYGEAYRLGRGVDLRPAVRPVFERWGARVAEEPQPVGREIQRAMRLFFTRDGQLVGGIERFQKAKEYLDAVIERFVTSPEGRNRYLAGVLTDMKKELLDAVDGVPGVGTAYQAARAAFSDRMRARDILERYKDIWDNDAPIARLLDDYAGLSTEEQKLARAGMLWGAEAKAPGDLARDATGVFRTARAEEVIPGIIGRSKGMAGDQPQRFGRYVDLERSMTDTRDVVRGGSTTARNVNDDLALGGMEALQQAQGFIDMFRGSASLLNLGQRLMERMIDRSFGLSADRAKELARILFTANPDDRAEILRRLAVMMPPDRMARFNELMQRTLRATGGGITAGAGAVGAPAPQPGGPYQL